MPLNGKSIDESIDIDLNSSHKVKEISLELLTRVLKQSEKGALKQAADDNSLLLIKISTNQMQDNLPAVKAEWIRTGNTEIFIKKLKQISEQVWGFNFIRYEGIKFKPM